MKRRFHRIWNQTKTLGVWCVHRFCMMGCGLCAWNGRQLRWRQISSERKRNVPRLRLWPPSIGPVACSLLSIKPHGLANFTGKNPLIHCRFHRLASQLYNTPLCFNSKPTPLFPLLNSKNSRSSAEFRLGSNFPSATNLYLLFSCALFQKARRSRVARDRDGF